MEVLHKGYIIKSYPLSPNLKIIVTEGRGGKIPDLLSGAHMSVGECIRLIDKYLKEKKVKPNAKVKPTDSKL